MKTKPKFSTSEMVGGATIEMREKQRKRDIRGRPAKGPARQPSLASIIQARRKALKATP